MGEKQIPWIKFNPTDFMDDENVCLMCDEALGLYMRILCYSWKNESIPNDPAKIMRIFKLSKHKFSKLWPELESCFFQEGERLFQKRLTAELNEARNYFQQKSDSGSEGAKRRWHRHKSANGKTMQDKDREEDIDIKKTKAKKMEKPTMGMINDYFISKQSTSDEAEKFYDFYESKGWKVGKAPMKKWQSAANNWIRRNKPEGKINKFDTEGKNYGKTGYYDL